MYRLNIYNKNNELIATEDTIEGNINMQNISQKLSQISTAKISIFHKSPICKRNIFKKGHIFKIFKLKEDKEILYFTGILRGIEVKMQYVDIILNDKLYLLERRVLRENKNFTNQSISYILGVIFDYINGIFNTGIRLKCSINDYIVDKEYKKNTNILSILQDLAKDGFEFFLKGDVLHFEKNVGIDKSENFIYTYNYLNPYGQNIDSIEYKEDVNNFANVILSDDGGFAENDVSVYDFGMYEKTINKGYAKKVIENYNIISGDYNLQIKNTDFLEIDIGDFVYIDLETGSDFLYFKGKMKIIEKDLQIGDLEKITFKISENNTIKNNFFDDFKEMKNKILFLN